LRLATVLCGLFTLGCPDDPEEERCLAGSEGCRCREAGYCSRGLSCNGDYFCVNPAEDNGPVPREPACYTPCKESFTNREGQLVECDADGLMLGCLDDARCERGTCRPKAGQMPQVTLGLGEGGAGGAGATPVAETLQLDEAGVCVSNVDCPDFQVCIEGSCYSNCERDSDCASPRACYRKACRLPCAASEDECPSTTFCSIVDAENGYCLPLREAEEQVGPARVSGTFEVSADRLEFSASRLSTTFKIVNRAPAALEFTLKKVAHTEYGPQGQEQVLAQPMPWLSLGRPGAAEKVSSFKVVVDADGGEAEILVDNEAAGLPDKWEGTLSIGTPDLGDRELRLSYAKGADGRWAGAIYYFAQFGDENLADWRADRADRAKLARVGNAFVQRWGALRNGRMTLDEFDAVLTATSTGSWTWPSVQEVCPTSACYLYSNPEGYVPYSDSLLDQPVPSGVTELPIALDLKVDAASSSLRGRIASSESLQYAGDPAVRVAFAGDPDKCAGANDSACLAFLDTFESDIVLGGRYATTSSDRDCARAQGFKLVQSPWLVPGFTANTEEIEDQRYTFECRDQAQPFGTKEGRLLPLNASLSLANPIKDGRSRKRRLELIDGALVNQTTLYLLVRETFDASFLGIVGEEMSAYGFVALRRVNANLEQDAFDGNAQRETRANEEDLSAASACSDELLQKAVPGGFSPAKTSALVTSLIVGVPAATVGALPTSQVHYLCGDTKRFDQGPPLISGGEPPKTPEEALGALRNEPCPAGSPVTFFTGSVAQGGLSTFDCQDPDAEQGSCDEQLQKWLDNGQVTELTVYRCQPPSPGALPPAVCDGDRRDPRNGKEFFLPGQAGAPFASLSSAVADAFRYKTRFRNRQGTSLGFAPEACPGGSNAVPYCYDAAGIDEARERIDCLNAIYRAAVAGSATYPLNATERATVRAALQHAYAYSTELVPGQALPQTRDGFERLNAELLIMLGDEAYTKAFQSRFDLAKGSLISFEGSKLEAGGIDLSGVAGFEMYTLYQATQYYQLVLDRFFSLSPDMWASIHGRAADAVISQETVTSYFDRVLRASTQKSKAWSEVAKRYQAFNRADLARFVVQRAFTAAYVESVALSQLMKSVVQQVEAPKRADIRRAIDDGARSYRAALSDMREVYGSITDQTGYFGFAPDYVPFPALEPGGPNAFAVSLAAAKQAGATAAQKEQAAIASTRAFETDSASFQAELARIRNTYENQLAEVCGTFVVEGTVYPATETYAYLDENVRLLGNPCGLVGNGGLHEAMLGAGAGALDLEQAKGDVEAIIERAKIELDAVKEQCDLTSAAATVRITTAKEVLELETVIRTTKAAISTAERTIGIVGTAVNLASCIAGTATDCPSKAVAAGAYAFTTLAAGIAIGTSEAVIATNERRIDELQNANISLESDTQCELWRSQAKANFLKYALDLERAKLEAQKTDYRTQLALGVVQKLWNQASRLLAEQDEVQQLSINVEAAKNNPNVRIYKNDAIINADRTFYAALREAYRASKVFEYYTSQSYAKLDQLALVRLVEHGDYTLESYLAELEEAYVQFREVYGSPDDRVDVVSVRDDVLQIPRIADNGQVLRESERVALFRAALKDTRRLDARGYLTIPFATGLERVSPLTRNHKLTFLEAELIGSSIGDGVGRVYLRQAGTGTIAALAEGKDYYRFPARTAVVNTFFNGVREFAPEVYRSDRLRDRPYSNTRWELLLNQRDEQANLDVDLGSLTDIRLYLYYQDFTGL
jgi:hypothetical protein